MKNNKFLAERKCKFSNFELVISLLISLALSPYANSSIIIEFSDMGSDLFFSWSGSLNASAGDGIDSPGGPEYATLAIQNNNGMSSTFYSAPRMLPHRLQLDDSISYLGTNNPGLFATLAPDWSQTPGIMPGSSSTGLGFMFRVNNTFSGEIVSVDIWGDWGAANTPFSGTMTIANQSISSMGMVDGYSLQTSIGDITFVNASAVPLPAGIYLFLSGLVGLGLMRGRNV